jgi:hypothetical protein
MFGDQILHFLEKLFYFLGDEKCIEFMIFNKNDFLILKKIEKNSKNINFGLQIYFNMENTFNGRIDVLNLEMGDTM